MKKQVSELKLVGRTTVSPGQMVEYLGGAVPLENAKHMNEWSWSFKSCIIKLPIRKDKTGDINVWWQKSNQG